MTLNIFLTRKEPGSVERFKKGKELIKMDSCLRLVKLMKNTSRLHEKLISLPSLIVKPGTKDANNL